jgi:hypothetical protein
MPGSGTSRCSGSSSSLAGRSSLSRRSVCRPHASNTDTADELAAADVNRHPVCTPFDDGLTRASISPYDSIRTMSERQSSSRVSPADNTVVPSEDRVTRWSA